MRIPDTRAVDVVVVSYNSRDRLRSCVEPLLDTSGVRVIVVDNASPDASLEAVRALPVTSIQLDRNGGFAHACNVGWRAGHAPYVLFLNPDARIPAESLARLVDVLESDRAVGVAGPTVCESDGSLDFSQRRFPRLRSTYAHALFLNKVFARAPWSSELVQDPRDYEQPGSPDWVSGACMLVRRSVLETVGGWDEGFFMYCEDKDLCRRVRAAGFENRYEPAAVVIHEGGASAPRAALMPVLAASRLRYAEKHQAPAVALLERAGVGLTGFTHMIVSRGGKATRAGHAASLLVALGMRPARSEIAGRN
jgi:N-acetylglucosaminyl-diphospho-decaprenol L-rhamnosyltransferase